MKSFIYPLFFILILLIGIVGGLYFQQTLVGDFKLPFPSLKTSIVSTDITTSSEPIKKAVENIIPKSQCAEPLYYSFGVLDKRFNITSEDLLKIMAQVEKIWEDNSEYNLFEYREDAEFKINFIFDSRQERTLLNERLDNQLLELKKSQKSIFSKHTTLTDKYESLWDKYSDNLADFEKDVKKYNEDIKYWNNKGGAPEKEYAALLEKKEKLSEKQKDLKNDQKKINKLAGKRASLIDDYNTQVNTYNSRFGVAKNFTQGKYFGDKINVYQFRDDADLILTLAHEFGHALNINHVQNSTSVMYYLMKDQDLNNLKLTKEDIFALKSVCDIK